MEKENEKILIEALELLNQGKSREEILNLFPKNREEIEEIFRAAGLLRLVKGAIVPPKKLLGDILSKLPATVAAPKTQSLPALRLTRWLILVPVGGLALLLLLSLAATQSGPATQTLSPASPSRDAETLGVSVEDAFDLSAINEESALAGFDADLYEFLSEEASLEEVD